MIIHHKCSVDISVSFPALDRLVDFLGSSQQSEVDALAAKLGTSAKKLNAAKDAINKAVLSQTKT